MPAEGWCRDNLDPDAALSPLLMPVKSVLDPVLGRLQIGKGGMLWSVEPAKAMLEKPLTSRCMLLTQAHEHGHKPLACEDQAPILIRAAGRDEHGLKRQRQGRSPGPDAGRSARTSRVPSASPNPAR